MMFSISEIKKNSDGISFNSVLEIKEKLDDPVTPRLMSRMGTDGKFLSPALEDLYPFLDEEELKKWMWK